MQGLAKQLTDLLKEKDMKIVTAESCTGGLLSASLTHKPGASEIFERGYVTYSNESKHEILGVPQEILNTHGAVSIETAEAMAQGALENSHADIAVSITGIAGPDGGSPEKPVGLVFLGYALKGGSRGSVQSQFEGSREDIQLEAAKTALKHLISVMENS